MADARRILDDFTLFDSVRLICCIPCQVCVLADGIATHLKDNTLHIEHTALQAQTVESLAQEQWPNALLSYQSPKGGSEAVQTLIGNNSKPVEPFPYLPVSTNGLACSSCTHICLTSSAMAKHVQVCHRDELARPGHRSGVAFQRFTNYRLLSSRFEVVFETEQEKRQAARLEDPFCRALETSLSLRVKKDEERLSKIGGISRDQLPPFVKKLGWADFFHGYDFKVICELVQPPGPCPEGTPITVEAIVWVVLAQVGTWIAQNCRDASSALTMEMQRNGSEATTSPFQCPDLASTIRKYSQVWGKVVLFFLRVGEGEDHDCPPYFFTPQQAKAFALLKSELLTASKDPNWKASVHSCDMSEDDVDSEAREDEATLSKTEPTEGVVQQPFLVLTGVWRACLDFCLSLLCQQTQQNDYELPLVVALSCFGVTRNGWAYAGDYTQYLSAVVTLGNIMFLQGAIHSAYSSNKTPPPVRQHLKVYKDDYGVLECGSAMAWAIGKRSFGFAIHHSVGGKSRFLIENGTIHFRNVHIHHLDFAHLVQAHHIDSRKCLASLLMVDTLDELPVPPLERMIDNPNVDQAGASIARVWELADKGGAVANARHWLCERIASSTKQSSRFMDPESQAPRANALRAFLQAEQRFLDMLMVLIHVSYGFPARGTELVTVRHTATPFAGRNIIISHGHVCIFIEYNKNGWVPIHRFLPDPVGELVLWYLAIVHPFSESVRAHLYPDGSASPYLWPRWGPESEEQPFNTNRLSKNIRRLFGRGNHKVGGVKDYRQLATLWGRDHVQESMLATFQDRDPEHDELGDNGGWATSLMDRQMGHSSDTAIAHYGRLGDSPFFSRPGQPTVKGYLVGSSEWWRFVGFLVATTKRKKKKEADDDDEQAKVERSMRNESLQLQHSLGRVDLLSTLRAMLRLPEARFRGKQADALKAIIAGQRCVLVVLPTAGGKSLLYQLPAFTGLSGLTVVVTPYVALEHDQAQKCIPYRIPHAIWDANRQHLLPRRLHLLFVTPEAFILPQFQQYMSEAIATYRLQRVVIDEFHECLTHFRKAQRILASGIDYSVQIVAMTATLEPRNEDEILRLFDLPRDHATVIRDVTTQKQHRYSVIKVPQPFDPQEGLRQRVAIIKEKMEEIEKSYTANAQFFIFCNTTKQTAELALALEATPYWSGIENGAETMTAFLAGRIKILVTTSAASCGIDGKGRIFVIMDGAPQMLQQLLQCGGRGARDGLLGAVIVISGPQWDMSNPDEGMQEFLRLDQCHRIALDRFDEPRARTGCELGEVPCDYCHARNLDQSRVLETPLLAAEVGEPPNMHSFDLYAGIQSTPLVSKASPSSPASIKSASSFGSFTVKRPVEEGSFDPTFPSLSGSSSPSKGRFLGGCHSNTPSAKETDSDFPPPSSPLAKLSKGCHIPLKRPSPTSSQSSRSTKAWTLSEQDINWDDAIRLQHAGARLAAANMSTQNLQAQFAQRQVSIFANLEASLDILVNFCVACGGAHTANKCRKPHMLGLHGAMPMVEEIRQTLTTNSCLHRFTACFKCLVPMCLCPSWTLKDGGFSFRRTDQNSYSCRQGTVESYAIMWLHLKQEYGEYLRNGPFKIDVADTLAHVRHLGSRVADFKGNEMMCQMMVCFQWMVELLESRYGKKEDWGSLVLLQGLIGAAESR